jgi:hypothetical protein
VWTVSTGNEKITIQQGGKTMNRLIGLAAGLVLAAGAAQAGETWDMPMCTQSRANHAPA